jgi:hypothetical protein
MKLVFIFGNGAVGKMTVGQELMKITDLRLFHNHMTIEPVLEIFGEFNSSAVSRMRQVIFEEFAKSNKYGIIFTFMWAFDSKSDWDYVNSVCDIFKPYNTDVYYVELVASKEVRHERNSTENRLANKASKRDLEASERRLIIDDENHRFESLDGELPFENYIKIDNSDLSAEEAAARIREAFQL